MTASLSSRRPVFLRAPEEPRPVPHQAQSAEAARRVFVLASRAPHRGNQLAPSFAGNLPGESHCWPRCLGASYKPSRRHPVGSELSDVEILLRFDAERCSRLNVASEKIAGGNGSQARGPLLLRSVRLASCATAGRSHNRHSRHCGGPFLLVLFLAVEAGRSHGRTVIEMAPSRLPADGRET
jgi:hypothetical protein